MSRDDSTDLQKEVTFLRLRLHHSEMQVEHLTASMRYMSIEAKSFESKWLLVLEENEQLRKDLVQMRQTAADELQATREDLDRANETLAKLFKISRA